MSTDKDLATVSTAVDEGAVAPPWVPDTDTESLAGIIAILKSNLKLTGDNAADIVSESCVQLGISAEGTLLSRAQACRDQLVPAATTVTQQPQTEKLSDEDLICKEWEATKRDDHIQGRVKSYSHPFSFNADHTFRSVRNGLDGAWSLLPAAGDQVILRMDWKGKHVGDWAEFTSHHKGKLIFDVTRTSPGFNFMSCWRLVPLRQRQKNAATFETAQLGGVWCLNSICCGPGIICKKVEGPEKIIEKDYRLCCWFIPVCRTKVKMRHPNSNAFYNESDPDVFDIDDYRTDFCLCHEMCSVYSCRLAACPRVMYTCCRLCC